MKMDDDLFDWTSYLEETHAKSVPSPVFKHIVPECMCGFEPGMKLEVPNKDYKNTYWLATIVAKASPLILVRYEGFQDNNEEDFWCNTLSDDIHPVGWCAKSKHALKPPKVIQHKEQNWYSYLIKNLTGTKKASENLFLKKSHPAHYLRAGQYVEILDPHAPLCYWLARINEVFQGRLNLQYEGWDGQDGEFWCFYLHENLRPVGHGIKNGLKLCPPKGAGPFSTLQHNRLLEKVTSISKRIDNNIFNSLFMGWTEKCPHELAVGMKLESVHPKDPTGIYVASVCRVFDEYYFLVQIDTLLSTQDDMTNSFMAHKNSSSIFPVGWCFKNGLTVNQPAGYIGKFTWDAYLKYAKADPVPESFFSDVDNTSHEIEVGMKLEAVDKENQRHICVCTVSKIVQNQLWLHIDGDTRNDQIFPTDSHDIFPIGWCESTGHELQWPRPYTLEQKNRISSLRSTVSRQNRLEILRKGKLRADAKNSKDMKKEYNLKKRKSKYLKGHRGRKSKQRVYDETESSSYADNTFPIVCINQLAKEYNTEDCIKKSFGLDSNGRLPMEVVTIDDDDEDEDIPLATLKSEPKFNEKDLAYLSYIRVKPNNLTKSENDLYEKKLKENEHNCIDSDVDNSVSTPSAKSEKRSLSSVVAMLRSSNKQSRTQLLELYKKNKARRQEKNISEKENSVSNNQTSVIDLCDDNGENEMQSNSSDNEYHVQKIMTKPGEKNKIILKLGKSSGENHNSSHPELGSTFSSSSPNSQLNLTHVNEMHSVTNMVRRQPGLNEIMKTRCHKVRGLCKDLPKNPLLWTKRHVALFIQNADFKKYAKKFFDQEIDGHSLLLLTVWEIHHLLGVNLGPAMKIHDYIFSLQQLVNDAYLKSKNKVLLQSKPSN